MTAFCALVAVLALACLGAESAARQPNIVFLVVESTDGRTWLPGYQSEVIPLPSIRALQKEGVTFRRHYSNTPVCCPSRATFWSGRHAHRIPHEQPPTGANVHGVWNNYEGLPLNFTNRIDQVLKRETDYDVRMSGKRDWSTGSHTLNVQLNAWTMYTRFPYDINATGGWRDEKDVCRSNGTVLKGNASAHQNDWDTLRSSIAWLEKRANATRPWFVYQGMQIVHPPYQTNEHWLGKIDESKIEVPEWVPLDQLHPCDLQSSMLKGCVASDKEAPSVYSKERRRRVRAIYYAMIAEFDAMVGEYMKAVRRMGAWDNTVFIVTSDHGDMQMEHQQFYKMAPYDASSSVPLVILDGRVLPSMPHSVVAPTQLIDMFPTIMEYAGVDSARWPSALDGHSLRPFMAERGAQALAGHQRPNFVASQFHGCNIAMSWFMVVEAVGDDLFKLIVWGTGKEVPAQLFKLTTDPSENVNLADEPAYRAVRAQLDASLRSVIDYPAVAMDVAHYNKASFTSWANATHNWRAAVHAANLRWSKSWDDDPSGAMEAINGWLQQPAQVLPCRGSLKWPAAATSLVG